MADEAARCGVSVDAGRNSLEAARGRRFGLFVAICRLRSFKRPRTVCAHGLVLTTGLGVLAPARRPSSRVSERARQSLW